MLQHRAFLHQVDGYVTIADGAIEVSFSTLGGFETAEPGYALPEGVVGVVVEWRGDRIIGTDTLADGSIRILDEVTDADRIEVYVGYTDKVEEYQAVAATLMHPLYGVTDLEVAKTIAANIVVGASETERLKYISRGAGKALTYEAKREETARYRADPDPQAEDYPWAADRAQRLGVTISDVIDGWETVIGSWAAIGIAIEATYETAVTAINAAASAAAVKAVVDGVVWPQP